MTFNDRFVSILLVGAATLLARPSHAQAPTVTIPGCYRVEVGAWNGPLSPGFHPDAADLPRVLELDTAAYIEPFDPSLSRGAFVARRRSAAGEQLHPFGAWRHRPDGSISIGPLVALSGFMMSVWPIGEELRGIVLAFTEAISAGIQTEVEALVTLQRVTCPDGGGPLG